LEAAVVDLFWLSDEQWAVLEPFMPRNQPGGAWTTAA
jgi:transposase